MVARTIAECPFCQAREGIFIRLAGERLKRFNCCGCDALGPPRASEQAALQAWNGRPERGIVRPREDTAVSALPAESPAGPIRWDDEEETW